MDSLHMIVEVPPTRKSITWDRSLTSFKEAKMGIVSVAVESMGFPLVTEKAGIGREVQLLGHAGRDLASVWLQMGIQVFAMTC